MRELKRFTKGVIQTNVYVGIISCEYTITSLLCHNGNTTRIHNCVIYRSVKRLYNTACFIFGL